MTTLTVDKHSEALHNDLMKRATTLLKQDTQNNWAVTDLILEAEDKFPDSWEDFFTGGQHNKSIRTIQIMRRVGIKFPRTRRAWQVGYSYYRELYADKYTPEMVDTLLSGVERGDYENREDFRAHKNELLGSEKEAQRYKALGVRVQDVITALIEDYGLTEDTVIDFTAIVREDLAA